MESTNIKFEWFLTSNTCEYSQIFTFLPSEEEEKALPIIREIKNTNY